MLARCYMLARTCMQTYRELRAQSRRILSLQQLELASLAVTRFLSLFSHLVLKLRAGINWFEETVATSLLDATSLIRIKRVIAQRFTTV